MLRVGIRHAVLMRLAIIKLTVLLGRTLTTVSQLAWVGVDSERWPQNACAAGSRSDHLLLWQQLLLQCWPSCARLFQATVKTVSSLAENYIRLYTTHAYL